MDITEILHERIEAYLNGTLDPAQRTEFEQQLLADEALQKEVNRHRKAAFAINYGRSQALKSRLTMIDKELAEPTISASRRIPLYRRIAVAASVLILIAAGAHFYAHRTYSSHAIATHYFASSQIDAFRGQDDNVNTLANKFVEAEKLFQEGKYESAAQEYQVIIKEDSLLKEQAEWNLALSYYAVDPASPQFKLLFDRMLADTQHDYHQQAKELHETMQDLFYKLVNH
jgi:hypothetical protein